jgi:hypothetical protein
MDLWLWWEVTAEVAPLARLPQKNLVQSSGFRVSGKGNSNSHGASPVQLIITMIKWTWTSRFE